MEFRSKCPLRQNTPWEFWSFPMPVLNRTFFVSPLSLTVIPPQHMNCSLHESFTNNDDNYRELKGVIQSLPPFHQSLTFGGKRIQFEDESDNSEEEEEDINNDDNSVEVDEVEDRQLSSPFQSTPTMSTIQLTGSKPKSHFISIHSLIGPKCGKQVIEEVEETDMEVTHNDNDCSSAAAIDLVPPSVDSPDKQTTRTINNILNNSSPLL